LLGDRKWHEKQVAILRRKLKQVKDPDEKVRLLRLFQKYSRLAKEKDDGPGEGEQTPERKD